MVAVPCDRALYDLPVHSGIAAELVVLGPLLKVEEIAKNWKASVLSSKPQSERAAEM